MSLLDAMLALLLLALLGTPRQAASGVLRSQVRNRTLPSATTLAGCPKSCGDLRFDYPFGIGPGCFREPDFSLTCDTTAQPPNSFFPGGTTEVVNNLATDPSGKYFVEIAISLSIAITMRSGVDVYNMSWKAPGRSFSLKQARLNITGCNFDVYVLNEATDMPRCTSVCPNEEITETMALQNCSSNGCCPIYVSSNLAAFGLRFVHHSKSKLEEHSNRSSLWDTIKVITDDAHLSWSVVDQPSCASAVENKTNYACISSNSFCNDSESLSPARGFGLARDFGYTCKCKYIAGNPYVIDGCLPGKGYNPAQQKANCSPSCGNISVPFPFGLGEGCSALTLFLLNCSNNASSILESYDGRRVTHIDIDKGLMSVGSDTGDLKTTWGGYRSAGVFVYLLPSSSDYVGSLQWAIPGLTCQEAQKNKSSYACVSINSKCIGVNIYGQGFNAYRCKCLPGFRGNPYVRNGCEDIDECKLNYCNGTCRNWIGGHHCSSCPTGTVFDHAKRKCTVPRIVILGVATGLGCGFGLIALAVSAKKFVRMWKRGVQKKIRRTYFQKNKGLLLEQLISSDERIAHQTRIFSLEELEKATNNFDITRIVGRGGHGTVYKGILSDQHVVAIKRSKIVEQSEIYQFINEVTILSQIVHRNVVKLFGCCLESEVPLLVYEFISNGSLYDLLHGDLSARCLLTWSDRIRIALEASGALAYLHSAASIPIFHRDVKSANILLGDNFTTKVSDFGASRSISIDETHVVTIVQGTFGYLDPEYYHTSELTAKSDVYSFGVILVELLTRKKPIFLNSFGEKQNLSHYVLQRLRENATMEILDAQVVEEADQEEIDEMASLVELCLRVRGEERPTMKEVELRLQLLIAKRTKKYQDELLERDNNNKPALPLNYSSTSRTPCIDFGMVANVASQEVSMSYSMEQELVS